jgi:hypothetical protein
MSVRNEPSLLLVAGPSGSGKSTFMEMLKRGELQPSLEDALPRGSRDWPQFGNKRKHAPTRNTAIVLHYTIIYPRLTGSTFEDDPVLAPLRLARKGTVLTIRADPLRVARQYQARIAKRDGSRGHLRKAVRSLRRRLLGKGELDPRPFYSEPGWLAACIAEWDDFLRAQSSLRELTLLDVIPVAGPQGSPDFQLAHPHSTGS